ncbi:MAG: surface lipoprotein assembly modifier [Paracoccaceae bacterium]
MRDKGIGWASRRLTAGVVALWFALGTAPGARAEVIQLDAENLYRLALVMIDSNRPEQALAYSSALVQRDPDDARALALKSWAERDLGLYTESVRSGRLAWAKSDTDAESFGAAMAVAQGLSSRGQKFLAQIWLRRAMAVAPDDASKRLAERDFAYVRTRSRLWLRFDASVQPSNNVNNGSSSSILWFYGLPLLLSGDAQALSGVEGNFGLTLKYRLAETEKAKTDLTFAMVQTAVVLSDKAQLQAPTAKGSDYAFSALEVGLEQSWRLAALRGGEMRAALTAGHSWYGGAPLADYLRVQASVTRPVSPRLSFNGRLLVERQNRLDSSRNSSDIWSLGLGMSAVTASRDRVDLGLSYRDTASESTEIDHERLRLDVDWTRRKPVLAAEMTLGVWAEMRDFSQSRYSADGRTDHGLGVDLSLAFETVDYMGFIPVVTLSASRTSSNISLFDSENLGVGFSIRSKF